MGVAVLYIAALQPLGKKKLGILVMEIMYVSQQI